MSVGILKDEKQGYSCMYDTVTMWAFGGIFYENENIEDFLKWLYENVRDKDPDPRSFTDDELAMQISLWRNEFIL